MTTKSFKPQIKNSIYGQKYIDIVLIVMGLMFLVLLFSCKEMVPFGLLSIIIVIVVRMSMKPQFKKWDMGGYEKITIDTSKSLIIFDDNIYMSTKDIASAEFNIFQKPELYLFRWPTCNYIINGELKFTLDNGVTQSIAVQVLKDTKEIIKLLKYIGVVIKNDTFCEEKLNSFFDSGTKIWAVMLVILVLYLVFHK